MSKLLIRADRVWSPHGVGFLGWRLRAYRSRVVVDTDYVDKDEGSQGLEARRREMRVRLTKEES